MAVRPKILAFAGSLRRDSFNKKMVKIAKTGAEEAGADVTYIDLADFPLPVYNQDDEDKNGLPENVGKLKDLLLQHDGFLIASPEYNSSISSSLKNMIDWVSRPRGSEPYLNCFTDKAVMLMSASPGALGGLRGLVHVRSIFGNVGSIVLPQQKCIPNAAQQFDASGNLQDAKAAEDVKNLGRKLAEFLKKYKS